MDGLPRIELGISLAGLDWGASQAGLDVRAQIAWVAEMGLRWVVLDGSNAGVRAREMGRSARRDLASLLRRHEISCAGVDLWIPPKHLSDAERVDRAVEALGEAAGLAADLAALTGGRSVVCCTLARHGEAEEAVRSAVEHAARSGGVLADCGWPVRDDAAEGGVPGLGVGVDPATVLLAGEDPARTVSRLGGAVVCARLSDADDSGRVTPGRGRLDRLAYEVAAITAGVPMPMVLDLRGIRDGARHVARLIRDADGGIGP